jgi:predicted metalloprotease with PDZ domain
MGSCQQTWSAATNVLLTVIGAAFLLAAVGHRQALARPQIAYRISLSPNSPKDVPALQMDLTIENLGKDHQLDVRVPAVFGPAGSQFPKPKLFTNFEIDSEVSGGHWVQSSDTRWRVQFDTANEPVIIRYTLKQPYSGPPFDRKLVFSPAIQPDYWCLTTSTSLMVPEINGPVAVSMRWEAPGGAQHWKLVSSYGAAETEGASRCEQAFVTDMNTFCYLNPDTGEGHPSYAVIFLFGDYKLFQRKGPGGSGDIVMALYGLPDYVKSGDQLFEAVYGNIARQRAFWGDRGQAYFLVNFVTHPNRDNDRFGGYNLNSSFTSFIPQSPIAVSEGKPVGRFNNLMAHLSHEYVHTWLRPDIIDDREQLRLYFLVEGGAEYYGEYFMLREGVVDFSEHVARYNDFLKEYYGYDEEARLADMQTVSKQFWAGDNYQRQPYVRGLMLLHNWHARIRRQSNNQKGLNTLIPPLVTSGFKQPVTLDSFQAFSQTLLQEGVADDILAHWVNGEQIVPDPDTFGPWCKLQWSVEGVPKFVVNKPLLQEHGEAAAKAWFD